jgi:hypothetical protein
MFGSINLGAQQYVEISAEIMQTNYNQKNHILSQWSFPVMCIAGKNRWRIDNGYTWNGKESWYFDGTNVYGSLQSARDISQSLNRNATGNVNPIKTKPSHATITICPSPGGHPLGNLGVNIPWLAFCSGNYLKGAGRVVPLPVLDIHGNIDSLSYTDKAETFEDALGLPTSMELFTSRAQYLKSLGDDRLFRSERLRKARLNPEFKLADGILRFRYAVHASTNFNGWSFPTEFNYFDYRSADGGGAWNLVAKGAGKIKSIRATGEPENVFVQGQAQAIVDMRFRHPTKLLDAITYTWTNAIVPSTNDPILKTRFAVMTAGVEADAGVPSAGVHPYD